MNKKLLSIKGVRHSAWSSKGPNWTISVVNEDTFRFSEDDSEEYFEYGLEEIEKHAQLISIPFLSYANIVLKIPKQKTIYFKIDKSMVPVWRAMQGPPTARSLVQSLNSATKHDIPFGLFLIVTSLIPEIDSETQGIIQDADSALLGVSIFGIAFVARKMPNAIFFLFQMAWELVFVLNTFVLTTFYSDSVEFDTTITIVYLICLVFMLVFVCSRCVGHYRSYKRYISLTV